MKPEMDAAASLQTFELSNYWNINSVIFFSDIYSLESKMAALKRAVFLLAFAMAIVPTSTWAQRTKKPNLLGSWKLVSYYNEIISTGQKVFPLGEKPNRYLIYTPQRRMMALLVHENQTAAKTEEDRITLHKQMFAYSGSYKIEGDKVTHSVDVSWSNTWTGTDQLRFIKLDGDTLTIKAAPAINPVTGLQGVGTLVWLREKR